MQNSATSELTPEVYADLVSAQVSSAASLSGERRSCGAHCGAAVGRPPAMGADLAAEKARKEPCSPGLYGCASVREKPNQRNNRSHPAEASH